MSEHEPDRRDSRIDKILFELNAVKEDTNRAIDMMEKFQRSLLGDGVNIGLVARVSELEATRKRSEQWRDIILKPIIPIALFFIGVGILVTALVYAKEHL